MGWRRHSASVVLLVCLFAAISAQAQRVVALTEARNAAGQAGQAYAQAVDFGVASPPLGAITLPGAAVDGAAFGAGQPSGYVTVAPSAQKQGRSQWAPGFFVGFDPLTQAYWGRLAADPGGSFPFVFPTAAIGADAGRVALVHRGATAAGHRLDVYSLETSAPRGKLWPHASEPVLTSIPLPYTPEAATLVGESLIALAGLTESRGLWVALYDDTLTSEPVLSTVTELPPGFVNPRPTGMAASVDGAWVAAAVSGRRIEGGSSVLETLVYVFDAATIRGTGSPVAVPGEATANGAFGVVTDGVWVFTSDTEGGFAYATRLHVDDREQKLPFKRRCSTHRHP